MTCGLVHASYSLPEWQAVQLTFFAPCFAYTTESLVLYCKLSGLLPERSTFLTSYQLQLSKRKVFEGIFNYTYRRITTVNLADLEAEDSKTY